MGGATVPCREAATPDRAVVVGGLGETPRNCDDDTIVTARINEIRSLSLISALRVNSGTCGWLARNKGLLEQPRCLQHRRHLLDRIRRRLCRSGVSSCPISASPRCKERPSTRERWGGDRPWHDAPQSPLPGAKRKTYALMESFRFCE